MNRDATGLMLALAGAMGCTQGAGVGGDDDGPDPKGDCSQPADPVSPAVPPEIDGRLTINELMTENAFTIKDPGGVASDWIEIYNPTDTAVPLHGYGLTDDLALPGKCSLPAGPVVPPRGHLVLWADHQPALGTDHLSFRLARERGEVGLSRPDGSWIDRVAYEEQETDFSAARTPDGSDRWKVEWQATPGAANPMGDGRPMSMEVSGGPPEPIAAAGDLSEQILGYDVIPEIAFTVSPEAALALEQRPREYVPAQLTFAGRTIGPVGLRLKGSNSFQPFSQKPSLRINIDQYVGNARFFGLKDLTLNNMDNDFSMMHERLAYRVAREAGVPSSRANHALVTVNGQFYGLYTNVETVKRVMLGRWFEDPEGPLYEATDVDFVAGAIARYELESGPDDRSLLMGLANALALASADEAIAAAGNYANLDSLRRYWAMCAVIGQFDAMPYSMPGDDYFVYADPITHRLWFMPWGMDETFYSSSLDVNNVSSVLARRCRESPACYQAFVDQVWDVLALTERLNLVAEHARVAQQIAPHVARDLRKPYSTEQVQVYQQNMYWFISERRQALQPMLPP